MNRWRDFSKDELKVICDALYKEADNDDPDEKIQERTYKAQDLLDEIWDRVH